MVRGLEDRIINTIVYVCLAIVGIVSVFPLMYVLSVSLTPYGEVLKHGGYVLIPQSITFAAYQQLLSQSEIPHAMYLTMFLTLIGTVINLLLTTLMAYPLSRKNLPGRKYILLVVVFTMLFSGGIIPTYLIVKDTGLIDSIWAMIIPNAIWSFNVLVMKSFFENLPEELFEAARIDGSGEFAILWRIVAPISVPVMLTIGLFYAVGHWNEFFQAIMYITNRSLYPLQVVVRNILMQSQSVENVDATVPTVTMQMAAVILASIPIILVYPFVQKHFTKGMMLGSIKG